MHPSALYTGKIFFDTYCGHISHDQPLIVDLGSQDVNGSLRDVCPSAVRYIGLDLAAGKGVDVVMDDPYQIPLEDESVDIVLSSSCFEHLSMFWLSYLEIMRILKPAGLFYLNAPSSGQYHRYPIDCWRFYPDAGLSLCQWGERQGYANLLLESFIRKDSVFRDFVGVFIKDQQHQSVYPDRILNTETNFENGIRSDQPCLINHNDSFPDTGNKSLAKRWKKYFSAPRGVVTSDVPVQPVHVVSEAKVNQQKDA